MRLPTAALAAASVAPQLELAAHEQGDAEPAGAVTIAAAYAAYSRLVAHIGARIIGPHDEIEDLVQDVFFEAARWLDRIKSRAALKHWLITVTVRAATRRREERRLRALLGLDADCAYHQLSADSTSAAQSLLRDVCKLLAGIAATDRRAWILRYVEGESIATIAERSGCSMATVKRRVARAQAIVLSGLGDA